MKKNLSVIVLLAAFNFLTSDGWGQCGATTSHTFTHLGGNNCQRGAQLSWPTVSGASSYTVKIMYHGGTGCSGLPSGSWITYSNVQTPLYITMPRCFSLDLEIITNCSGGGTSSPYVSGFTFCWPLVNLKLKKKQEEVAYAYVQRRSDDAMLLEKHLIQ